MTPANKSKESTTASSRTMLRGWQSMFPVPKTNCDSFVVVVVVVVAVAAAVEMPACPWTTRLTLDQRMGLDVLAHSLM